MTEVELWVLVDGNGQSWVNADIDCLDEDKEAIQPTRLIKVTLRVPTPVHVELSATVPAELIPEKPVTMTVK